MQCPSGPVNRQEAETSESPSSESGDDKKLRVLVVDDNVDSARTIGMFLRLSGHDVETRHDGLAALEAAQSHRPDAVVLDLGLPKLDGFQVAEQLREREDFRETTLIAVSGYGHDDARKRSQQAGFDHHLIKPVDTKELLALIECA